MCIRDRAVIAAFLKQYYNGEDVFLPKEVLVSHLPEEASTEETLAAIRALNEDPAVTGILPMICLLYTSRCV